MLRHTLLSLTAVCTAIGIAAPAAGSGSSSDSSKRAHIASSSTRAAVQMKKGGIRVYSVPTSSAGLTRITTAPNGSLWFVERDKNTVGRLTPKGRFDEFNLPETSDDSWVMDLDIAKGGRVWVVWDQGSQAISFDPGNPSGAHNYVFDYPYGEEVRMGPGGKTPWITMSYDKDGIIHLKEGTFHWEANAPECDGALGRGTDGHMWCADGDDVIRVDKDGNGGTTAALPDDVTYPNSIAPGPNGAVWIGRDDQGSWFTYPAYGNIGWVKANRKSHFIKLGDRVAPRSLVRKGKDVWFTSVGGAKGIGHINKHRAGAVTKVGNYHPTSLTIGKDGAVWFTDADHNVIVRVPRSKLGVTNVNLGDHSHLRPRKANRKATLKVRKKGHKRVFHGKVKSAWPACRSGKVQVRRVKGKKSVVVGHGKAGKLGAYTIKVKKGKVKKGKYFTRAVKVKKNGTLCTVANSPKRKVH